MQHIGKAMATQVSRVNKLDDPVVQQLREQLAARDEEIAQLRERLRTYESGNDSDYIFVNKRPCLTPEQVRERWKYKALSSVSRHIKARTVEFVAMPNGRYLIYADTLPLSRPQRKPRSPNKTKTRRAG